MGDHIDHRGSKKKKHGDHDNGSRHERINFKRYLRDLEEELLDADLDEDLQEDQDDAG